MKINNTIFLKKTFAYAAAVPITNGPTPSKTLVSLQFT